MSVANWRIRLLVTVGLCCVQPQSISAAQQAAPTAKPQPQSQTQPAQDPCLTDERCASLYESALGLSKAGQFVAALDNYQQAYARKPVPWLLTNIGRVQQKMGNPKDAIASYRQFLDSPGAISDPEAAQAARQWLKQAEQDLANPRQPKVVFIKDVQEPRPKWRLGVGGTLLGVGVIGIGLGIGAVSANGKCADTPVPPVLECDQVYRGLPAGLGLLISGGVLSAAGIVLIALPGKRTRKTVDSASAQRDTTSIAGFDGGMSLTVAGND